MDAGKLRHRITIEASGATQDGFGEPIETWATVAEAWASREDMNGQEAFTSQQVRASEITRFTLRFVAGLTSKMRVTSDGLSYNVTSVSDPDGRKRTLVLLTTREG